MQYAYKEGVIGSSLDQTATAAAVPSVAAVYDRPRVPSLEIAALIEHRYSGLTAPPSNCINTLINLDLRAESTV